MAADWGRLAAYLVKQGDEVTLSWAELDALVGGMPASATRHAAFWAGDRPHTRAWRQAGFTVKQKAPGQWVTFRRLHRPADSRSFKVGAGTPVTLPTPSAASDPVGPRLSDVILVSCSKSKAARPSAARDLYTSSTFRKARAYAERVGRPWFILSAEHALVRPEDWLAPYDRYLPDTPPWYRQVWGEWVTARLELLLGNLGDRRCEVHAGEAYVEALRGPLTARGVELALPLQGLRQGQRSSWYDAHIGEGPDTMPEPPALPSNVRAAETHAFVIRLTDRTSALHPDALLSSRQPELESAGLYSWWVDDAGASHLTEGLGLLVEPGLIYAGQGGATRWPSGRRSDNTLRERLVSMHLGGNASFSTFRLTLGAVLRVHRGWDRIDEAALTEWMKEHLSVIAVPHPDPDQLGALEHRVLEELDPPLNLKGMASSAVRRRLTELRREARGAIG